MKEQKIDMVNGPIAGKLLLFAIPLMLSSMLQLLFNAADIVVVGRYAGSQSLAAVGSTSALINLMTNLFIGLSVGANVVIANYLGAGKQEEISKALHTAITLALCSGFFMLLVGTMLARQFLMLMDSPADVIDLATKYLRIYFLGMPALMLYNFGSAILRSNGDTRRPLVFLSIAGVLNVLLNLYFVITLHMGVSGVALATIISQYISAGLIIRCLCKEEGYLHLELRKLSLDYGKVKKILHIGLPAGLQGVIFGFSNVVIQSSINSFGSVTMAGSAASGNIEGFIYMAMNALHQTAITYSGQNYGARKLKRVDKVLGLCLLYVTITGLLLGGFASWKAPFLLSFYATDPKVIAQGVVRLRVICTSYFLCGIMDVLVGVLRGMNHAVMPMVVSILGVCGLRLVWIATIFQHHRTPEMLYISYAVSWIVTLSVHMAYYVFVRRKERV